MNDKEFTYKAQDVNYLGFLEAQLRDLQGIDTLAYELIQNADDAKAENGRSPTTITFDITDEALIVSNDGVFRPLDFARLQSVAGGDKRTEVDTTGAFGLGFIAVYQVTDAPEIFSSGRHWQIQPDAPAERRIRQRRLETSGTRLRLPWAFDAASPVRRTLRLPAIRPEQLDNFAAQISAAIETAALFLRQLQTLTVRRNGVLVRQIERQTDGQNELRLRDDGGKTAVWLLLHGDFAALAAALRTRYEWQIEAHRRSQVRLALPLHNPVSAGRLFAVLPTETTTPLPFHINADFFPTIDRKRIHFDNGYQAEWNEAAVACAAAIIADHLAALPAKVGPAALWRLLQQVAEAERLATVGELPAVFATFWQKVAPLLPLTPLVYTAQGEWRLPAAARLLPGWVGETGVSLETAVSLLTALDIPIVHPDLRPTLAVMGRPEVGCPPLTVEDVAAALAKANFTRSRPLYEAPPFLATLDAWQLLWHLLAGLLKRLERPAAQTAALDALNRCALVLTDRMLLVRPNRVYRGRAEARALFPDVDWLHESVPTDTFPGRFVTSFGVRQAVDLLAEMPDDQLAEAWRLGRLDLPRLWRWFEAEQIEILADDPSLRAAIRRLPLCPAAGELRPLAHLYLPGGFEDPLKLAGLVDLAALGGRSQFLRDLGVPELTFAAYVQRELPRVLVQHPDLPSDARQQLLQLLATRLGEIRDDDVLQTELGELPLIPCMDGVFRAARHVYATREVIALLGDHVYIAEPAESQAVQSLYAWLGVRIEPTAADIAQSLLALARTWAATPLDTAAQTRAAQCWQKLNDRPLPADIISLLRGQPVMPNRRHILTRPDHLFWPDQAEISGKFTGLDEYLLPETLWGAAVAAVGVRPLSAAVQRHLIHPTTMVEDPTLAAHIAGRRPLLERLLPPAEGDDPAAFLDSLRVWKTPSLQIEYRLPIGDEYLSTAPETAAARLDSKTNRLLVVETAGERPWPVIARELALTLTAGGPVGMLALGLKEILAAETYESAAQVLAELGL
jgi:hypothetical protein